MIKGQEECFAEGVLYAVSLLIKLHDQPKMAAEIVFEAGLNTWDCSNLDDFEKEALRAINVESDINLKGL